MVSACERQRPAEHAQSYNDCVFCVALWPTVPKFLSEAMNGSMFPDYIQHELVPSLHAGDLVIMDNLRCHKVKGVKEAIQQTKPAHNYFICLHIVRISTRLK